MNLPELMSYYPVHPVFSDKWWFEGVQPPRSHLEPIRTPVKLPCTPRSLSQTMVQTGSREMNLPKLMSYYPVHPVLSDKWWFEGVQLPRSHLEPIRTPVKLPCTPGSLSQMVVREGSKELNHPEVIWNQPVLIENLERFTRISQVHSVDGLVLNRKDSALS